MKIAAPIAALAMLVAPSMLIAEDAPAKQEETAKNDPNKKIVCHTDDQIGSRLRKQRVCMTVAQWRELNDQAGMMTERKEVQTMIRGGG